MCFQKHKLKSCWMCWLQRAVTIDQGFTTQLRLLCSVLMHASADLLIFKRLSSHLLSWTSWMFSMPMALLRRELKVPDFFLVGLFPGMISDWRWGRKGVWRLGGGGWRGEGEAIQVHSVGGDQNQSDHQILSMLSVKCVIHVKCVNCWKSFRLGFSTHPSLLCPLLGVGFNYRVLFWSINYLRRTSSAFSFRSCHFVQHKLKKMKPCGADEHKINQFP